jgi:hypothetical protein
VSGPRHTTSADIERELTNAEVTLRRVRQTRQSMVGATLAIAVIAIVALAVAVSVVMGNRERLPLAVGLAIAGLAALVVGPAIISRLRRHIATQERHMVKTVNWIREVFPLIAEREHWSVAQIEAVRKRIAHFPLATR